MENSITKQTIRPMVDFALEYYKRDIPIIAVEIVNGKPLDKHIELLKRRLSVNEVKMMFEGLNFDNYGLAILTQSLYGYFEGIRFKGTHEEISKVINELLSVRNIRDLIDKKKIAITYHDEGIDISYRLSEKPPITKTLEEETEYNGQSIPFIRVLGDQGYFMVAPSLSYSPYKEYCFPYLITDNERTILQSLIQLYHQPSKYYMDDKIYGRKDKLISIANKFNDSKDSEYTITNVLRDVFGWEKEIGSIWVKKLTSSKSVYGYIDEIKKDKFWISEKVETFEPNVIYRPFDLLVLEAGHDYLKAIEKISKKSSAVDISEFRKYEETLRKLGKAHVEITEQFIMPEPYIYIQDNDEKQIVGTVNNLSVLSGKAKVGKTLLLNEFTSSAFKSKSVFKYSDNIERKKIVYFDTEQSRNHSRMINDRIIRTTDKDKSYIVSRFELYNVTNLSHEERINVIEEKLYSDSNIAVLIIDGIVDLVQNYNSPDEVSKLMTRLLKWKDENPIHIMVVIHENKGNSLLRGHLGTELMNKAETVIGISKKKSTDIISIECKASRNKEFKPMSFKILDGGFLEPFKGFSGREEKKSLENLSEEEHYDLLVSIYEGAEEMQYEDLRINLKESLLVEFEIQIGDNKVKSLIRKFVADGLLQKFKKGVYTFKSESLGSSIQGEDLEKTT